MGIYYRLESTDFETIDSLLLVRDRGRSQHVLLLFRITCNTEELEVSEEDLRGIDGFVLPKNTRKYHVVVTPQGVEPEIKVPEAYLGKEGKRKLSGGGFLVFNCPIPANVLFPQNWMDYI